MRKIIQFFTWIALILIAPLVMAVESVQLPIYEGFSDPLPLPVFVSAKCRDVDRYSKTSNIYAVSAIGKLETIYSGSKQIIRPTQKAWINPGLTALRGEIHLTDKTVNYLPTG